MIRDLDANELVVLVLADPKASQREVLLAEHLREALEDIEGSIEDVAV